jgi:formylmethanofuran dehydrogenase subunit E-like metal-binding protein
MITKNIENKIVFRFKIYENIACLNDGFLYQLQHSTGKRTKVFRKLTYSEKRKSYYINGILVTKKRLNNLKIKRNDNESII